MPPNFINKKGEKMPKEKETFSERERIRRAKESHKYMSLQERIEFLKGEKVRQRRNERQQLKGDVGRAKKEIERSR